MTSDSGSDTSPGPRRPKKSRLLQGTEYLVYRAVAGLVASASDHAILRWGNRLGSFSSVILRGRDRLAAKNLLLVFPEKSDRERNEIRRECWRHFGRSLLEYLRMPRLALEEIERRCDIVGREILDEAVGAGRGVILISAHFGSWEIGGLLIMSAAARVRTVARVLDNEYLERDLSKIREKTGAEVIDRRKAARPLMKALADKSVVVLLPDQAVLPREGILAPFLGHPGWTTPAPAKLALRHESPIVFAFCIPAGTRHRLEFGEPIYTDRLSAEERTTEALTARINDVISARIRTNPALWLWMHDRWKTTAESGRADEK